MYSKKFIKDEQIIEAVNTSLSMAEASVKCGLAFSTFVRRARALGIYSPNQGRKGIQREKTEYDTSRFKLEDILAGKHPQYHTVKLKSRLLIEGVKEDKCEVCGISEWNGKPIKCELHHIDGNNRNHELKNLQMICPNCHSQTDTFSRHKQLSR